MGNLAYLADKSVYFAIACTVMIALCAGLFGVVLVLKRYSMLGDGLSHIAFGAYAVAAVLSFSDNMILTVPVTVVVAILLLRIREDGKIKGETMIAMLSTASLAIGYIIMSVAGGNNVAGDVCTTLFGGNRILCLTAKDVGISCGLAGLVVIVFFLFYNRIFAVVFDENFASASGLKVGIYKTILAVVTSIVIVLAMELVGALLISALIVFPAMSAMRFARSFKSAIIGSAIISVLTSSVGLLVACVVGLPVGPTVVVASALVFGLSVGIKTLIGAKNIVKKA